MQEHVEGWQLSMITDLIRIVAETPHAAALSPYSIWF